MRNADILPERVTTELADASTVAEGQRHACALTRRGEVWCRGDNDHGQLGDGRVPYAATPRLVLESTPMP